MNKDTIAAKLHESLVNRASKKVERGKTDFYAYPLIGSLAVGLTVGMGKDKDNFFSELDQAIADEVGGQVYAIRSHTDNGLSDGRNRVRASRAPIKGQVDRQVVIRAASPRTQSK